MVLSGGAAFGAYQAGAWATIEESGWRPDYISGISIGAVNGFAISRGATGEDLRRIWLDWPAELAHAPKANLWTPPWKIHTSLFIAWIERLYAELGGREPLCPMDAVLLEIPRLRFIDLPGERIDADLLRATCALPGILPPVRVDGSWYIDSGLLRLIPMREALEAGADELLAVDLLWKHPLPPARLARIIAATLRDRVYRERTEAGGRELKQRNVRWIRHPRLLGSLLGAFRWSRKEAERQFELGREDARRALE